MLGVGLAPEDLQVLCYGSFDFGIARQCATADYSEASGGFLFSESKVTNAVIDNDPGRFLRHMPARTFGVAVLLSGH